MRRLSLSEVKRKASSLEGKVLETLHRKKQFDLTVESSGFRYTPESGKRRSNNDWATIQRVLDRFNKTGSFSPGHYTDLTWHASYLLVILHKTCEVATPNSPLPVIACPQIHQAQTR